MLLVEADLICMKTALITGANRGLGLALAERLVALDYNVIATTRQQHHPSLGRIGNFGNWIYLDVTSAISISMAVNAFARKFASLDLLINNAAVLEDGTGDILTVTPHLLERTMRTNVSGALLVTQAFWPYLKKAGGRVINISSSDAECLDDCRPAYAVSKAALNAVTMKLQIAGKRDGVSVNHVNPGWFRSGMGTDKAPISAEEAALKVLEGRI